MTPFERRMGAITKASAEIFLGDVQGGFVRLLEAISIASESGWGQMVTFGTLSAGIAHVLAGRIDKGVKNCSKTLLAPTMRAVKCSTLRSISFCSRKSIWKC